MAWAFGSWGDLVGSEVIDAVPLPVHVGGAATDGNDGTERLEAARRCPADEDLRALDEPITGAIRCPQRELQVGRLLLRIGHLAVGFESIVVIHAAPDHLPPPCQPRTHDGR